MPVALVCVAGALGGCGGGAPINKSFAARANDACADFNAGVEALPPPVGERELLSRGKEMQQLRADELMRLRMLSLTASATPSRYPAFLADLDRLDGLFATLIHHANAKARGRDITKLEHEGRQLTSRVADEETALGLTVCVRDPTESTRTYSEPESPPRGGG